MWAVEIENIESVKRRQFFRTMWVETRKRTGQVFWELLQILSAFAVALLTFDRVIAEGALLQDLHIWLWVFGVTLVIQAVLSIFRARSHIRKRGEWRGDSFVFHSPNEIWSGYRAVEDNDKWVSLEIPELPATGLLVIRFVTHNTKGVRVVFRGVQAQAFVPPGPGMPLSASKGSIGVRLSPGRRRCEVRFFVEPNHDGRHIAVEALLVSTHLGATATAP